MSQGQRTPGPILLYAKFNTGTTAKFLGTAVTAPEPENEKFKLEVMNDLGGRSVPFQLIQDGEKWFVAFTLNRYNGRIVEAIRSLESGQAPVLNGGVNPGLGNETGQARGTLVIGATDFQLLAINSYFNTPAAGQFVGGIAASDLPQGKFFYSCNLRKYKESTVGTRVLEVAMLVECQNVFIPSTRGFACYTENPANFPAVEPFV